MYMDVVLHDIYNSVPIESLSSAEWGAQWNMGLGNNHRAAQVYLLSQSRMVLMLIKPVTYVHL